MRGARVQSTLLSMSSTGGRISSDILVSNYKYYYEDMYGHVTNPSETVDYVMIAYAVLLVFWITRVVY